MTGEEFWQLIDLLDQDALLEGDEEFALAALRDALERLSASEIEHFEEHLARRLYAIDGRAFADAAGASGRSGEAFLYARCFVVARGRAFYESVQQDPSTMPGSLAMWCESLLSAAPQAYENATGSTWEFTPTVSYETGSNKALWAKRSTRPPAPPCDNARDTWTG